MVPQSGQSFGRYDVGRQLGRGGMGIVFEATHRDLERAVALKVLAPELAEDPSYRNRFLREARILARLDSPHVVRVFDAGEHDGSLFLATELLPDGDLAELIERQGALSPTRAADLVRQVASGLYDAHRAGILHRDIKPSNVLLKRLPDGTLRALLCDFGIAAVSDGRDLTATQGVIGTPPYMAPERHDGAEATIASDIYALGCVLWSTVTGHAPYEGSAAQILLGHLQKPIPQLLGATAEEVQFNQTLRMAMAKDPAARFRSADAFGRALGYFAAAGPPGAPTLERSTPSAPPPPSTVPPPPSAASTQLAQPTPVTAPCVVGPLQRARRGRRRLVAAAIGVLVLVAATVGGALLLVGGDEPSSAAGSDRDASTSSSDATPVPGPSATTNASGTDGPLAIDADFVNQPCNDEFVVILATSGDRTEYEEKLGAAVRGNPDARYLDGSASCAAFLPEDPATGALVFNAYLGPFPTMSAACQTLARIKSPVAWVRRLANPSKVRELCFCLSSASQQPTIAPGYASGDFRLRHQVRQAQWALATKGLLREDQIYGAYTDDLVDAVTKFQRRRGFEGNGLLDSTTWQALHADYCPVDAYLVER
ncbi:protein kinase [Nocardioides caeni]|uniref:non-specific serine/threonine protein kinase n=1 Tax=Nocardioides caeni TaxID=574700 RepID=A0A4S8N0A0_9ACTN|nr:serine/threonine-protein kinase [Nocardioides caeni]THV08902.1 hypothetical protein E9934_18330 [Nocardioides caeni]